MNRAEFLRLLAWATVSPAVPGLTAKAESRRRPVLSDAAVLDRPVTYTETKIPLGELIQKVAADTGVPLTAAPDVADEPVAVVVKEFPARELLEQLADLLDYRWSRRTTSAGSKLEGSRLQVRTERDNLQPANLQPATVFEIWQDLASKQREEALRAAVSAAATKHLQAEVGRYVEIGALAPEQIQALVDEGDRHREAIRKLYETRPIEEVVALANSPEERARDLRFFAAHALSSPVTRALAGVLRRPSREQWAVLRRDGELSFASEPQSGERRLPEEVMRAFRSSRPLARPPRLRSDPADDPRNDDWQQQEQRRLEERWAAATGYRVLLRMDTDPSPVSPGGALRLDVFAIPIRTGAPPPSFASLGPLPQLYLSSLRDDRAETAPGRTPEERAAFENDALLGARKVFEPDPKPRLSFLGRTLLAERQLQEILPDIARTYGVQFISDAYWNTPLMYIRQFPAGEPVALYALMDRFADRSHRWERRGNLLRLRSRTWFLDRPREVPLRLVRRWQEQCSRRGALPLEEYVALATSLNEGQVESLESLIGERAFPADLRDLYGLRAARHALRLYGVLTPAQQRTLWHGGAVQVAEMAPRQRELFAAAMREPYRFRPARLDLSQIAGGAFSMSVTPRVRVWEIRDGAVHFREEAAPDAVPAQPPPIPTRAAAATPMPAVSRSAGPLPDGDREPAPRHPIVRLSFLARGDAEQRESVVLTVAPPP